VQLGAAPGERHLRAADRDVHRRSTLLGSTGRGRGRVYGATDGAPGEPGRSRTARRRERRRAGAVSGGAGGAGANRRGRLAIVPPRFGDDVIGGAEQALREAAEGLTERGWEVDVLTTCARDHFSWANEYPPGEEQVGKLRVVRFPTVVDTPRTERAWIHAAILRGEPVPVELQERWMN